MCEIDGPKDLRIEKAIHLRSYLGKRFLTKKVQNNSWAHLRKKKWFSKT